MRKKETSHLLKRGDLELSRSLPIDIAIEHTLQAWPTYHGGDPNLTDILFLANTIREDCNLQLEDVPLTKEQVVSIIELVEKGLLHNPAINPIWMDKLAIRAKSKDQIPQELSTLQYNGIGRVGVSFDVGAGC